MNSKTITLLCDKFVQDITYEILSESAQFYRRYNENIPVCFHSQWRYMNMHVICMYTIPRAQASDTTAFTSFGLTAAFSCSFFSSSNFSVRCGFIRTFSSRSSIPYLTVTVETLKHYQQAELSPISHIIWPPPMAVHCGHMGRKDEKSSSVLSSDWTIPMIMANDRQPMISYSCLTVTLCLPLFSRYWCVKPFWPLLVVTGQCWVLASTSSMGVIVPVGRRSISQAYSLSSAKALLEQAQCTSLRARKVCKCRCCVVVYLLLGFSWTMCLCVAR